MSGRYDISVNKYAMRILLAHDDVTEISETRADRAFVDGYGRGRATTQALRALAQALTLYAARPKTPRR